MTSHIVGVETKRESGLCLYRWRCSCTKTGKDWTARIHSARLGGAKHARQSEAGVGARGEGETNQE